MNKTVTLLLASALSFALLPQSALTLADDDSDLFSLGLDQLLKIEVVSRRFSESFRQVGRPLSVITQEDIRNNLVTSVYDLALLTPNLSFRRSFGRWQERPVIRGVASLTGTPSAGILLDGSPVSLTSPTLGMHDIEQVEVLRGPEAALFGRATFSGAINFISKRPKEDASLSIQHAATSQNGVDTTLWANTPLSDNVFAAVSTRNYKTGLAQENATGAGGSGYGKESSDSVSIATLVKASPHLDVYYRFTNQFDRDGQIPAYVQNSTANNCYLTTIPQYFCGTIETPSAIGFNHQPEDWEFALEHKIRRHFFEVSHRLDQRDFKIIFQKNALDLYASYDGDFYELNSTYARSMFNLDEHAIDLISNFYFEKGRWLIGTSYYQKDELRTDQFGFNFGGTINVQPPSETDKRVDNRALFTSIDYLLSDVTKLNIDLRYAIDEIQESIPGITNQENTWNSFSPRLNISQELSKRLLLYYSIAKGNQPGGFNSGLLDLEYASDEERERALRFSSFNQETLLSYDTGIKLEAIENKIFVSGSLFYYQWKDLQLTQSFSYLNAENETVRESTKINGGRANNMGLEIEVDAHFNEHFYSTFNLGYTRAKFLNAETSAHEDLTGNASVKDKALPNTPRWTSHLGLHYQYKISNSLAYFANTGIYFESKRYVAEHNFAAIDSTLKGNISAGIKANNWNLAIWAKNISNNNSPESVARFGDAATFFTRRAFGISLPMERSVGISAQVNL